MIVGTWVHVCYIVIVVCLQHSVSCTNIEVTSKFDPNAPGALVMPRPGQKHQVRGHHRNCVK